MMQSSLEDLLAALPGPEMPPSVERYVEAFRHGTMSLGVYAPRGVDLQTPHAQDELYIVHAGSATFVLRECAEYVSAGSVLFVPALCPHRFDDPSPEFSAWVVFWGPEGGEVSV